ncbi:MAG: PAS domain-containing sensor histidine kinase [Chloroflexota bacterium]|nr:PAS domain-containing sensor histidine kinase [Chloroflexota bacterium]
MYESFSTQDSNNEDTTSLDVEKDQAFQANIADSIADALIATDLDYRILRWNAAAERLYGWIEKDVLGKDIHLILSTTFPDTTNEEWQDQLRTRGYWQGEVNQQCKDGRRVSVLTSVSYIKDKTGTSTGTVASNRDITEWKHAQLHLQGNDRSEETEQLKDEFISVASHELRTPVTALKGYTQLLQRAFERQGMQKHVAILTRMDGQIDRLTKLITDLLDTSKMQMGKVAYSKAPFDFNSWVADMITNLQAASSHTITLTGSASRKVMGDKDRLEQVLINLITNAIKFSPEAERVDIKIVSEQDTVTVHVRDYGIGIPKEHHHKVFDRFFRASYASNNFPGMGIGLYISHEIVQAHNGNIWVKSTPKRGSTFFVSLPFAQD